MDNWQRISSFLSQFGPTEPTDSEERLREELNRIKQHDGGAAAAGSSSCYSHLVVDDRDGVPIVKWLADYTAAPFVDDRPRLELVEAYTRLAREKSGQMPVQIDFHKKMEAWLTRGGLFNNEKEEPSSPRQHGDEDNAFVKCVRRVLALCEGQSDIWRDLVELTLRQFLDTTRTSLFRVGAATATEVPAFLYHYYPGYQEISTMGDNGYASTSFRVVRTPEEFEGQSYDRAYWPDDENKVPWPVLESIAPTESEIGRVHSSSSMGAYQVRWASSATGIMEYHSIISTRNTMGSCVEWRDIDFESIAVLFDPIDGRTPTAVHIEPRRYGDDSAAASEESPPMQLLIVSHYSLPPAAAFAVRSAPAAAGREARGSLLAELDRCMQLGLDLFRDDWMQAHCGKFKFLYMGLLTAYELRSDQSSVRKKGKYHDELEEPPGIARHSIGELDCPHLRSISCSRGWDSRISVTIGALAQQALRSTDHSAFLEIDGVHLPAALDVRKAGGSRRDFPSLCRHMRTLREIAREVGSIRWRHVGGMNCTHTPLRDEIDRLLGRVQNLCELESERRPHDDDQASRRKRPRAELYSDDDDEESGVDRKRKRARDEDSDSDSDEESSGSDSSSEYSDDDDHYNRRRAHEESSDDDDREKLMEFGFSRDVVREKTKKKKKPAPRPYSGPHGDQLCGMDEFEQEEWYEEEPRLPVPFDQSKMPVNHEDEWTYGYFLVHRLEEKKEYLRGLKRKIKVPREAWRSKDKLDSEYKRYCAKRFAQERWPDLTDDALRKKVTLVSDVLSRVHHKMVARMKLARRMTKTVSGRSANISTC